MQPAPDPPSIDQGQALAHGQRSIARGQRLARDRPPASDLRLGPDQRPARDQRPQRTWLAVVHHLIGLIIGALSLPLVLAGVTVGSVLTPTGGAGRPRLA